MPLLFISHSSKDKVEAEQLIKWLEARNFNSLFLDSDAQHGIKAGCNWEKSLYQAIHRSHAFILLLSDNWVASQWCGFEFMQARALGKTIFPIRIQPELNTQIASDIQHLDFSKGRDDALQRLQTQLTELSLNTSQHTTWDRSRSPYPGMMAFEAEDAPVFFGRDKEINQLRERLNQHRIQGSASLLTLLAASGAGKSSLIRAGLLPRLRHDKRNWLVTDAMRPEREPLRKLAGVLAVAADQVETTETLYGDLQGEQAVEVLNETLQKIRLQKQRPESTLLLSIDQAEELFTTAKPEQTRQLLKLLAVAQVERLPILTLLAMRSEYLESLQDLLAQQDNATAINSDLMTLETLPLERISQLIRGPAEVAGLTVEDGLLSSATQDAATTDALPLLAFALRELYEQFGDNGNLTLAEYQQLGACPLNPLENAVQAKATQSIRPQQLSETELKALRDAFIPHMVRVNESGDYVRQPALWDELPAAAHSLLERLTNARLLIRRDGQIEVSHEALLRHWTLLNGWLREEHDFLLGKQQLELSLHDWQQLPEMQRNKGLLRGITLERAHEWLRKGKEGLSPQEKNYIQLSHHQAEFELQRTELALGEANNLINYINFELRGQLEPLVPLHITKELHARVTSYYKDLSNYIDSGEFLRQRAVSLLNEAGAFVDTGNLPAAESLCLEATHFMQQRVDSEPDNLSWQHDLSVSLEKMGDILSAKGELNDAKDAFSKSLRILQALAVNDSRNIELQRDLAASYNRLGLIFKTQGELDEAKSYFEKSQIIFQRLLEDDPEETKWQLHLSESYEKLSDIHLDKSKLSEAKQTLQKSLDIRQYLVKQDPSNVIWHRNLSTSFNKFGMILSTEGKLNEARTFFEKGLAIIQILVDKDRSNAGWQRELSVNLNKIGDILSKQDKLDEANAVFKKSLSIIELIAGNDPINLKWQHDLGICHEKIGIVLFLQEKLDESLNHFQIQSGLLKLLADQDPSNTEWQHDLSSSYIKIGDVLLLRGELNQAMSLFQKCNSICQILVDRDPFNSRWQHGRAFCIGKIADTYQDQNNLSKALEFSKLQWVLVEKLIAADSSNIEFQTSRFLCLSRLIAIEVQLGNMGAARTYGRKIIFNLRPLAEQGLLHGQQENWISSTESLLKILG